MPTQTTAEVTAPAAAAAPAPAVVAGAVMATTVDPAVYSFDGAGASFCRDVFRSRVEMNRDAADRLEKFAAAMVGGSPAQMGALATAAVETRVTAPNFIQQGYRPEMLLTVIDRGRPLNSRISSVNLSDATPYRLPVEGEFTGVGDHVEGTAHIAEGDLTMSDMLISPGAISGAFRLSRELIDASNPALDQVAVRAMARNYQAQTEAKLVAALLAADATATFNIDKVAELSDAINDFYDANGEEPSFIASSTAFYKTLRADVDTTGRPQLASINPVNAIGTRGAGSTGAHVDGVEIIKAATIATNDAFLVNAADVHVGESSLLTFRFDEVEGPGVVKLALWSYYVAKVLRPSSVVQVSSAAS